MSHLLPGYPINQSRTRIACILLHPGLLTLQDEALTRAEENRCGRLRKCDQRSHKVVKPCDEQ